MDRTNIEFILIASIQLLVCLFWSFFVTFIENFCERNVLQNLYICEYRTLESFWDKLIAILKSYGNYDKAQDFSNSKICLCM